MNELFVKDNYKPSENCQPKIGLVTVLYNSNDVLPDFFESLCAQDYKNYFLYIIENSPNANSIDDARRLAKNKNIKFVDIVNDINVGVAKGNNQGILSALKDGCDFVLLLNNDINFDRGLISGLVNFAIVNNEKIIVPKIYFYKTNTIWQAGGYISKWSGIGYHHGYGNIDSIEHSRIEYFDNSSTCFALIHRDVFSTAGLMDEKYFVYYDDTDFFYRCSRLGYKVCSNPNFTIQHKVSHSTGGQESDFSKYYGTRNLIYFLRKHYFFPLSVYYITLFVCKVILKNSMRPNKKTFGNILNALIDGFKL